MSEKQIVRLTAEIMWPNLYEKSEMSDKYQCDLVNLSKDAVQLLEAANLTVRNGKKEGKADKGMWITAKSNYAPRVYDGRDNAPKGTPWDAQVRIGNGSEAKVQVTAYDWEFKGKKGRAAGLDALKITKLEEMDGGGDPCDDENPGGDPF